MAAHLRANIFRYRLSNSGLLVAIQKCGFSSSESVIEYRNRLFDEEKKRQRDNIGRIEKIEVRYIGVPKNETLIVNKDISTPYNCAQHISESLLRISAVAVVNGHQWDLHRPLKESCTLQLVNFRSKDTIGVNQAFWRTCSFVLGGVLETVFKDDSGIYLHSFPKPDIKSGSFTYDFALKNQNWEPSPTELKAIGIEMCNFAAQNDKIERLDVSHDIALEMFKTNPFKREQLPNISNQNNGIITLYRAGKHIDISKGTMIGSTQFIRKARIASVHKILKDDSELYRIQGIALPTGFTLSTYAFNILSDRAKKLNTIGLQQNSSEKNDNQEHPEESTSKMKQRI
ncbi:hypothetical protein PVAND_003754 [Polypedilum vanderplanki]|uniref:TGS domain-containing protein n=1 Tax=Polypedilum vanderplanki TaxID=319348 RepID=A0A9J6BWV5_POLVA|nr:hypothetical protein PVAND_003754 [Polypedilum vanderplanki]